MFAALARFAIRRRWSVLIGFLLLLPAAGFFGGGVFTALKPGGFENPAAESAKAKQQLAADLGVGDADLIALYTVQTGTIDAPAVREAIVAALARARGDRAVQSVADFYSTGAPQLVSAQRDRTFAVLSLRGDDRARSQAVTRLQPVLRAAGLTTQFAGNVPVSDAVQKTVERDLQRAEIFVFPLTAVLLALIFGSLVSAGTPLVLGGLAIVLAFTALRALAAVTAVSVFAVNIVTFLGLGLAIDYSLFILNRYREELPARGRDGALIAAISTTGRAVAFSGVTVAASLAGLFVFPQVFLRSMAMGGIAVSLIAVLLSLTLLPALIAALGPRLDALRLPWARRDAATVTNGHGFWSRIALSVMRRPVAVAAAIVVLLLALGSPFLRLRASSPDVRVLSASNPVRQATELLGSAFAPHETAPHQIALTAQGPVLTPAGIGALDDYVQRVQALPGVARVESAFSLAPGLPREGYQALFSALPAQQDPALATGLAGYARGATARVGVVSAYESDSREGQTQVQALRALPPPTGMTARVGGAAAQLTDLKASVRERAPLMLAEIGAVMLIVLFLVFGSVTLPLKALVVNLLSLSASYGAMVWIFQDGRLQGLLRYQSLGTIDATQPILLFAIVFGLSMDYEVLLLSRIREEYVRTGDNTLAVAHGLEKTGRLITSAAGLLVVVSAVFATASMVFMKELFVGMALAIALDATVVRALLVPATMRLMGRWNWWAPAPLVRLWRRIGLGDLEAGNDPPGRAAAKPAA